MEELYTGGSGQPGGVSDCLDNPTTPPPPCMGRVGGSRHMSQVCGNPLGGGHGHHGGRPAKQGDGVEVGRGDRGASGGDNGDPSRQTVECAKEAREGTQEKITSAVIARAMSRIKRD